jgi:hypothetical protein
MKLKLVIYLVIILTVMMLGLHYLYNKYFVSYSEYWDYGGRKTPYGVSGVIFNMKGRMKAIDFSPKGNVEIMGIRADDTLEDVIRKLGKPSRIGKMRREEGYLGKKTVLTVVEYNRGKRGVIGLIFKDERLDTIFFSGGNPALPLGLKMGMKQEEVRKILGPPTKMETPRSSTYRFGFLDSIVEYFWIVFLYSLIRRRMRLKGFPLFLIAFFVFLFISAIFDFLTYLLRDIAMGSPRLVFQGFFSFYSQLFLPFLISSIIGGGVLFSFEHIPFSKKPKQSFLIVLLVYLVLSFIGSVFFQYHLGMELPYTLPSAFLQLPYNLLYFLLLFLFFYLFLPKETLKLSTN